MAYRVGSSGRRVFTDSPLPTLAAEGGIAAASGGLDDLLLRADEGDLAAPTPRRLDAVRTLRLQERVGYPVAESQQPGSGHC